VYLNPEFCFAPFTLHGSSDPNQISSGSSAAVHKAN